MGRLIDADKAISDYAHYGISHSYDAYDLENILTECPTVEAIPKDQYEQRLKADMVAMLTDIQLEIEECVDGAEGSPQFEQGVDIVRCQVVDIIQQKIDALREVIEDEN